MPDISTTMIIVLCAAAAAAGWIDAVVGGGGLLLLPALMLGLPANVPLTHALGTNKAVAIVGTTGAAVTYARKAPVDVGIAARIGLAAMAGAAGGALLAGAFSKDTMRPVIMVVLLLVAAFVIFRPGFGSAPATGPVSRRRVVAAIGLAGLGIGFYDGLIGPGTGTFLVLALTALLHLDLVTASATAKIVNVGTNAGALAVFASKGQVMWQLAALMAAFNLIGGMAGARMALKKGSGFVRVVLLTVVSALVVKLGLEQWG
ncbi:sulfite exporter TauE/SafE family protein [Streptomyces sp. NBC_00536]|uniref:sulfite exporter TauE/SafE family protein n=1 Tax=Streptomyces sp. NBC_00536 TaxID=2975769 RepID=UPI002E819461|nr:sulfite exporter TauE/SafE family protein [Streptomyces sp. NBC_00536]WUC78891.1 sulfite exporter TauE/SafE family protein [Streptomyces sp. NBC_00536]